MPRRRALSLASLNTSQRTASHCFPRLPVASIHPHLHPAHARRLRPSLCTGIVSNPFFPDTLIECDAMHLHNPSSVRRLSTAAAGSRILRHHRPPARRPPTALPRPPLRHAAAAMHAVNSRAIALAASFIGQLAGSWARLCSEATRKTGGSAPASPIAPSPSELCTPAACKSDWSQREQRHSDGCTP